MTTRIRIDAAARQVWRGDQLLQLSSKAFDFLYLLASHAGTVVTREQAMAEVWDTTWYRTTRTLDAHAALLRGQLGDARTQPTYITTVRGIGFRFTAGLAEISEPARAPEQTEELTLADTLRAALAELEARIETRAAEVAAERIAAVKQMAAGRVTRAQADMAVERQRWADREAELRRQIEVLARARDRQAVTL